MRRVARLLSTAVVLALPNAAHAQAKNVARYQEIRQLIRHNRHLSGHLVLAVDARTIMAVRTKVSEKDIPTLVQMMGDKDYGVASAASGLLVTVGRHAMPALRAALSAPNSSIVIQAQVALRLLEDCYDNALRDVMNPDVCPTDSPGGRPRRRRGSPPR